MENNLFRVISDHMNEALVSDILYKSRGETYKAKQLFPLKWINYERKYVQFLRKWSHIFNKNTHQCHVQWIQSVIMLKLLSYLYTRLRITNWYEKFKSLQSWFVGQKSQWASSSKRSSCYHFYLLKN